MRMIVARLGIFLSLSLTIVMGVEAQSAPAAGTPVAIAPAESPATVKTDDKATTTTDPRVLKVLDLIQSRYKDVKSLSGTFRQVKRSEVFLEETKSTGRFWHLRPNRFRCDYDPPYESVNIIVDNVAYLALPKIEQVEKFVFDDSEKTREHVNRLLLGFGIPNDELLRAYKVEYVEEAGDKKTVALRFLPRFEDESGISAIMLWVDRKKGDPAQLLIVEGDDETRITIQSLKMNPKLDAKIFEPRLEDEWKDWEVIDRL